MHSTNLLTYLVTKCTDSACPAMALALYLLPSHTVSKVQTIHISNVLQTNFLCFQYDNDNV